MYFVRLEIKENKLCFLKSTWLQFKDVTFQYHYNKIKIILMLIIEWTNISIFNISKIICN